MLESIQGALTNREELNHYLSRAITLGNGYHSDHLDDDLRLLSSIGAKFLGRSAYVWVTKENDESHFEKCKEFANRVHQVVADDVVLQAGIFEAIYPQVNHIPIPDWVFTDLGEPVERRNFSLEGILGEVKVPGQGLGGSPWGDGGVPDLTRPEAFRWFYYRARRYLECGYEALHLGQIHLVGGRDRGYAEVEKLIDRIRVAAHRHARRGWVILDAHSHGICKKGRLLLDFASRPASSRPLLRHPEKIALIRRGGALGGIHPGGWECAESPVVVEIDNWGGYSLSPESPDWKDTHTRAWAGKWGYDEINWMARLSPEERRHFLLYAHRWTQLQGEEWHFQMPVARSLSSAAMEDSHGKKIRYYRANRKSEMCPSGFGDEEAIQKAWQEPSVRHLRVRRTGEAITPEGLCVPEPITVGGELQPVLGGLEGDAACPWSNLVSEGEGCFSGVFASPIGGRFGLVVFSGGTQTDPIRQGGLAGGQPFRVHIKEPGTLVKVRLDYPQKVVEVTDALSGASLLE